MKVVRPLVEAELPSSNKPTAKITAVRPLASKVSPTKKVKPDAPPTTLDAQLVPMLYMAVCQDTLVTPSTSGLQRFRNAAAKQLGADGAIALHGLNLGPRAGSVLARCVTNARAIDLRGNAMLADQGALALFPLLEHGTLRALDLSGCGLRGAFAPALARTLLRSKGGAGAQLQELQLGGGGAAPKAVAQPGEAGGGGGELVRPNRLHCVGSLAAALQERAPRLRLLGLGHNTLGAAPPELVDASVLGLAALLSNARQLKSVDLSHNGFSAAAAAPLLHSLPACAALTSLDLSGNALGDAGAELLAAVVSPDGGGGGRRRCRLKSLSLCGAGVRVGGGRALASAVRGGGGASLEALALADNALGDDGAEAFAAALAADGTALRALNLGANGIGEGGARALGDALRANRTLRALALPRNALGDAGTLPLAACLVRHPSLATLDLAGCRIADRGALAIALSLSRNSVLRRLDLRDNLLTDKGGRSLLRIQERDGDSGGGGGGGGGKAAAEEEEESALEKLSVGGNQLSFGVVGSLKAMCEGTRRARLVPHELKREVFRLAPAEPLLAHAAHALDEEASGDARLAESVRALEEQLAAVREATAAARAVEAEQTASLAEQEAAAQAAEAEAEGEAARVESLMTSQREAVQKDLDDARATNAALEASAAADREATAERPDAPPRTAALDGLRREIGELETELDALVRRAHHASLVKDWAERQSALLGDVETAQKEAKGKKKGAKRR